MDRLPEELIRVLLRTLVETPFDVYHHWPFAFSTLLSERFAHQRYELQAIAQTSTLMHRLAREELERRLVLVTMAHFAALAEAKDASLRVEMAYVSLRDIEGDGTAVTTAAHTASRVGVMRDVLPFATLFGNLTIADLGPSFPADLLTVIIACPHLHTLTLDNGDLEHQCCSATEVLPCIFSKPSIRRLALSGFDIHGTGNLVDPISARISALALHCVVLTDRDAAVLFSAVGSTLSRLEWVDVNHYVRRSQAWLPNDVTEEISLDGIGRAFGTVGAQLKRVYWAAHSSWGAHGDELSLLTLVLPQLSQLRHLEVSVPDVFGHAPLWTSIPPSLRILFLGEAASTLHRAEPLRQTISTIAQLAANMSSAPAMTLATLRLVDLKSRVAFHDFEWERPQLEGDLEGLELVCRAKHIHLEFCVNRNVLRLGGFAIGG